METLETNQRKESDSKVIVAVPDISGKLVGYRMVHSQEDIDCGDEKRAGICSSVIAWDVEQKPIDNIEITGFHTGWQDFYIHYDLSLAKPLAWLEDTLFVMGELYDNSGEKIDVSPTKLLNDQIEKLNKAGYEPFVATELEFYLTEDTKDVIRDSEKRHDYRIDSYTNSFTPFFDELCEVLSKSNIGVESWQSEWGVGQWEVNLSPGDPLKVAESHLLFKLAVNDIASKYGYRANFMAKPFSDQVGSSCHIHVSLKDKNQKNVFFDETTTNHLAEVGKYAIQGLLRYTKDLQTMYGSNINSYKRLIAKEFCGNGETWGFDNRTTTCRVIGRSEDSFHIEFRLPGADTNPYLALAGVLASVRKGIEDELTPPEPLTGDSSGVDCIEKYPLSLSAAITDFETSTFSKNEFGNSFVKLFLSHLKHEQNEFDKVVTEWELKRYR